jgi:hypothetical protein
VARDVEYDVIANDKGDGIDAIARKLDVLWNKVNKGSKESGTAVGKNLIDAVGKVAPKFAGTVADVMGMAGKMGGPALAAGLALATPVIGATIGAAVIGGAGAGGLVGGAMLAASDPRVKQAGTALGKNLLSDLQKEASASFVDPMLRNIEKVENRFETMRTKINRIFGNSAEFMDPMVDGVLEGVDGILDGLDALTSKGGPTMDALGKTIGMVGQAIGEASEMIAAGGDDAARAMQFLGFVLVSSITAFGTAIRIFTEFFGLLFDMAKPTIGLAGALGLLDKETTAAADAALKAAPATTQLQAGIASTGEAAAAAAQPVSTFTDRVNNLTQAGRSLYDSQTNVGAAIDNVRQQLDSGSRSLSVNSEAGRANRQALSNLAGALNGQYNAFVKVNGEGAKSNRVAAENRAAFIKLATQFTGSKKAAEDLATKMGLIPAKKQSDFHLNTHDAVGRANAARDAINGIKSKTVSVNVIVNERRLNAIENRLNRLGGSMYNAATPTWYANDTSSAVARTGGPTPVNATVESHLYLDGELVARHTSRQVRARAERDAWRQKVGRR